MKFSDFSNYVKNLLVGQPFGVTYPDRRAPPPPALDGRTAALRVLRRYLSELIFTRTGDKNTTKGIEFQISEKHIYIEWPDHEVDVKDLPVIALLSGGPAEYEMVGLGSTVDEASINKFAPNTLLQVQSNYIETVFIDVLSSTKQERRALLQGIVTALSPTEFMYGLRFRMPDYYNEVVTFAVQKSTVIEDEDSARGRRMVRIEVQMYFHIVVLQAADPLVPVIQVLVDADPEAEDGEVVLYTPEGDEDTRGEEAAVGEPTESNAAD